MSKKERKLVILGHLWRLCSIGIPLLIPFIMYQICQLSNTSSQMQGFIFLLSFGIGMLLVGGYDIIGVIFEFKHVLVSLQIASLKNPLNSISPRKRWLKKQKTEGICIGIIFAVLGLSIIVVAVLGYLNF